MLARLIIFFLIVSVVEIYFLQAVKTFVRDFNGSSKNITLYTAYTMAGITFVIGLVAMFYPPPNWNTFFRFIMAITLILFVCKLIGCQFLIIDDIIRFFRWIIGLFRKKAEVAVEEVYKIDRLKFLSQLAVTFTVIPAVGFIYGMVKGAY